MCCGALKCTCVSKVHWGAINLFLCTVAMCAMMCVLPHHIDVKLDLFIF